MDLSSLGGTTSVFILPAKLWKVGNGNKRRFLGNYPQFPAFSWPQFWLPVQFSPTKNVKNPSGIAIDLTESMRNVKYP